MNVNCFTYLRKFISSRYASFPCTYYTCFRLIRNNQRNFFSQKTYYLRSFKCSIYFPVSTFTYEFSTHQGLGDLFSASWELIYSVDEDREVVCILLHLLHIMLNGPIRNVCYEVLNEKTLYYSMMALHATPLRFNNNIMYIFLEEVV